MNLLNYSKAWSERKETSSSHYSTIEVSYLWIAGIWWTFHFSIHGIGRLLFSCFTPVLLLTARRKSWDFGLLHPFQSLNKVPSPSIYCSILTLSLIHYPTNLSIYRLPGRSSGTGSLRALVCMYPLLFHFHIFFYLIICVLSGAVSRNCSQEIKVQSGVFYANIWCVFKPSLRQSAHFNSYFALSLVFSLLFIIHIHIM